MSITKSYNKHTNTFYVYETTYEWSEEKQKKVQRKRCIGQFNPETGEIIPNGKVGRPSIYKLSGSSVKVVTSKKDEPSSEPYNLQEFTKRLNGIEETLQELSSKIHELCASLAH